MWGVNDFADRLGNVNDLKHEKGMGEAIADCGVGIVNPWARMGRNSADNSEISGSLVYRITKTLIYGNEENRKRICELER